MPKSLIEAQGLCKSYQQGAITVPALQDVNLSIEHGEFAVLAGPSGSGKTTLLNLIGGLDTPTKGKLLLEGKDMSTLSGRQLSDLRLHKFGFVFQAYNLVPVLTAYENAEYVLLLQGIKAEERQRRIGEIFEEIGLADLASRRPSEMSGGQQQRVAVARAIAGRPALVLADEPTANLDSKTSADLIEMMHRLKTDHGVTFIFSSHDPRVIDRAERLIQLEDGRVVSDEKRANAA